MSLVTKAGTIIANNGTVTIGLMPDTATVGLVVTGTWTGTLTFYASVDGTTFVATNGFTPDAYAKTASTTSNGSWLFPCGGIVSLQIKATAQMTGTAVINMTGTAGRVVTVTVASS